MEHEAHTTLTDPRPLLRRIREHIERRPDFAARYDTAREVVRVFRKPAFYEVTQRCNLKCEGCYYFEGGLHQPVVEEQSLEAWDEHFRAEKERGVSMAYFVGAEPSLEQERMLVASKYFKYGNIGCNGTVKIDPAVSFRVAISIWAGDEATDKKLRGAAVFRKAFQNYRGDPRVLVYYTLTRWNVDSARVIAEMCRDNGVPLTFNLYSPTTTFLEKLRLGTSNDDEFFRVSRADDSPILSGDDLLRARGVVEDLMADFPETVIYSRPYNDWSTRPAPLHEIDENGIAPHCGSRIIGGMHYYGSDLKPMSLKCCTPDLDCSECRMMSAGWSTKLQPTLKDVETEGAFGDWLDMLETIGRIFVYDHEAALARAPGHVSAAAPHVVAAE